MFGINKICTFGIASPIWIILYGYPYPSDINPNLKKIMEILGLTIDINEINSIYNNTPCNKGDILVYGNHAKNCIVFDLYKDPTDQLDVINFGVVCKKSISDKVRELVEAMLNETDKKVKISGYDFTSPRWAHCVVNGENYIYSYVKQAIIYCDK